MEFDGSFLRTDGATFSENGTGIWAHRNASIKIYGDGGVINSEYEGIWIDLTSTAGVATPVTDNGGAGIWIGTGAAFHDQGATFSGNYDGNGDIICGDPTAISQPAFWCGN